MREGLRWGPDAPATPAEAIRRALLAPAAEHSVAVEGVAVRFRLWNGAGGRPPVVLAHGMLAHARWWDAVAGWLAMDRPVVALDFSGMGESGRRGRYSRALHGLEIAEVARAAGFDGADLVAHSYGGDPALRACSSWPGLFRRLVLLDCRLPLPGTPDAPPRTFRTPVFPSVEAARARFRLWPESPLVDPTIMDHVVAHSLQRIEAGWTWKFDATMDSRPDRADPLDTRGIAASTYFVRGEESGVTTPEQMAITQAALPHTTFLAMPAAGHHLMLEQPVALTMLLRTLLA